MRDTSRRAWLRLLDRLRASRERSPEQLPGQRAGVLAVAQQHLAVHDRRRDAARALHESAGTGGAVPPPPPPPRPGPVPRQDPPTRRPSPAGDPPTAADP